MGIPDHLTCFLRNLYTGQEATVRTGHGTTHWFQIGKGVCQGYILSRCHPAYLTYMQSVKCEVAQSCPTLCDPMDCIPSGSSVYGILQARILEWVAISFSRGSSQSRDRTQVSHIAGRRFILWPPGKPLYAEYITRNARENESQAGIRIAGKTINNPDMEMIPL